MSVYGVIIDYNAFDVVFYILFIYFCNVCVCVCVCVPVCVCVCTESLLSKYIHLKNV